MTSATETCYITTAIDYPNSAPHMGHAYEKVVADFYARFARLEGRRTRFLIGLDEHGQKIQEAAEAAGSEPKAFVDEKAKVFLDLYDRLRISNDDFIRTSEPRHHAYATQLYERLRDAGDIYKGVYTGDYCISCERNYSKSELVDGKCPIHDRETTAVEEESYFFRLGKYRAAIREHIETNPQFVVPSERRKEILSRLEDEVHDLSISRSTFAWGVPVPDDADHVLYVWVDALSNYISALTAPEDLVDVFWPATCHVIGKDILWFHVVIWPAMLLSAGLPLPVQVYAHGFILDADGRKMAKQLGNVVDPLEVMSEYSVDVLRYYFLRAFSSGADGKFSRAELAERYDKELANDLGNLVLRLTKLVETRAGGRVEPPSPSDEVGTSPFDCTGAIEAFRTRIASRDHHRALDELWTFVRSINAYLNEQAPWKLPDGPRVEAILYDSIEGLRCVLTLLSAVLPETCAKAATGLGFEILPLAQWSTRTDTYAVQKTPALFPKREPSEAEKAAKKAQKGASQKSSGKQKQKGGGTEKDPFQKLDLRVGRIVEVQDHPDADKLFAMQVDIGEDAPRSICAGLREYLKPSELENRKVLVLANLKPAVMRGIESRGMVLATDTPDGRVVPVDPGEAPIGDSIRVQGLESSPKKKLSKSEFDKAPLAIRARQVFYGDKMLESSTGPIACDAADGSPVR